MAKHTFSKYALGITAAAMMTIPAAGIAGATSISPNGSTSDSGSNNISTLTDTTTPAPVSAEVTLDEVTLDEPAQEDPAPAPAEENSAFTDNPTPRDAETFEEISRAMVRYSIFLGVTALIITVCFVFKLLSIQFL